MVPTVANFAPNRAVGSQARHTSCFVGYGEETVKGAPKWAKAAARGA